MKKLHYKALIAYGETEALVWRSILYIAATLAIGVSIWILLTA